MIYGLSAHRARRNRDQVIDVLPIADAHQAAAQAHQQAAKQRHDEAIAHRQAAQAARKQGRLDHAAKHEAVAAAKKAKSDEHRATAAAHLKEAQDKRKAATATRKAAHDKTTATTQPVPNPSKLTYDQGMTAFGNLQKFRDKLSAAVGTATSALAVKTRRTFQGLGSSAVSPVAVSGSADPAFLAPVAAAYGIDVELLSPPRSAIPRPGKALDAFCASNTGSDFISVGICLISNTPGSISGRIYHLLIEINTQNTKLINLLNNLAQLPAPMTPVAPAGHTLLAPAPPVEPDTPPRIYSDPPAYLYPPPMNSAGYPVRMPYYYPPTQQPISYPSNAGAPVGMTTRQIDSGEAEAMGGAEFGVSSGSEFSEVPYTASPDVGLDASMADATAPGNASPDQYASVTDFGSDGGMFASDDPDKDFQDETNDAEFASVSIDGDSVSDDETVSADSLSESVA